MTHRGNDLSKDDLFSEGRRLSRRLEMLERLVELHSTGLLSERVVADLKQRVLNDEFNLGV